MTDTFFSLNVLGTPAALLISLFIGLAFGISLEQAGFGSSRRLAGIFYFRDMTVLKVMFTAVLTAMLGLSWLITAGVVNLENINLLETIYGAQILGGFLLGIGFVMGGWCPGTAAVGLAGGSLDALLFLFGAMGGSIIFNEWYPKLAAYASWGNQGVLFVYDTLGVSRPLFALAFTVIGVVCFWGSEILEEHVGTGQLRERAPVLTLVSLGLLLLATGLFVISPPVAGLGTSNLPSPLSEGTGTSGTDLNREATLLQTIETAADHIEPEDLADRLMSNEPGLVVVDVRGPEEFAEYHLPGALNLSLPNLPRGLQPVRNHGAIILYSNGMTHPAQARDVLTRMGFSNVFLLTDGLDGFFERCLKPVSLRAEPLSDEQIARVNAWRQFFLNPVQSSGNPALVSPSSAPPSVAAPALSASGGTPWPSSLVPTVVLPGLVSTKWLAENLQKPGLKLIDLRPQPEYNSSHLPGALSLHVESLRGMSEGIPSMLLPGDLLARQVSSLGIAPADVVILIHGDKFHDATLVGMAFERLGHRFWGILDGGFSLWSQEKRSLTNSLPPVVTTAYPAPGKIDTFTVDAARVLQAVRKQDARIIDVRPADFFTGSKSDEARPGHIPGAQNRPFTDDVTKTGEVFRLKPLSTLEADWHSLGISPKAEIASFPSPAPENPVIVHCRTGHQASQAYFILKHLLGVRQVLWYDGGWTEWSARPELPVE